MTELKKLDPARFKPIFEADPDHLPNARLRLSKGSSLSTRERNRSFAALKHAAEAALQLGHLPEPDESRHMVLDGQFPLFALVPAVLELAGQLIEKLTIATLSFSLVNVSTLATLVDKGQIKDVQILCSNYFAAASIDGKIYTAAAELCTKHGFKILAARNHAKLLLFAVGQRRYVIE